jgi:hypothetical protein
MRKKSILFLVLALAAGVAAFCITRSHQQSVHKSVLLDSLPELAWLRVDLKLTDDQFAKASALHLAYRPTCVTMCRNIADAQTRLDVLARSARGMTPELETAIQESARVHAQCRTKMLEHLYQTAGLLDDRQASRYLEKMIPHALDSTTTTGGSESCHKE